MLTAEQVSSSWKEVMKRVLAPVVALGVPVLGARPHGNESNSDRRSTGQRQNTWRCWPVVRLVSKRRSICRASNLREYAGIAAYDGLTALNRSLEEIEKLGQR